MKQKVSNGSGSVLKHSLENCCENCCELCDDGKAPYCIPNGEFKEVLSMDYVCEHYKDCKLGEQGK